MQTQKLIDYDKAAVVIGYPCPDAAIAARTVALRSKTLVIALASAPGLTADKSGLVLRPIGREDRLSTTVASYLKAKYSGKRVGALLPDAPVGLSVSLRAATNLLFPLSPIDTIKSGSRDFSWVNTAKVDALLTTGIPPEVVASIAQKNDELAVVQAANVVSASQSAVLAASKRAVVIANPNANLFPDARAVVQSARKDNAVTTGYFIYAYAAVQVFAKLADAAHGRLKQRTG